MHGIMEFKIPFPRDHQLGFGSFPCFFSLPSLARSVSGAGFGWGLALASWEESGTNRMAEERTM